MKHGLVLKKIHASVEGKSILNGVDLEVAPGTVHAIMGPNGGGKSTLAQVLLGHPAYKVGAVKGSGIWLDGESILEMPTVRRAVKGLFLAFQSPVAVPGVSVLNLLRAAYAERHRYRTETENKVPGNGKPVPAASHNPVFKRRLMSGDMPIGDFNRMIRKKAADLGISDSFLTRGIHDGFSGGEKKKIEMLQAMVLKPRICVFDEIDTGLDVDALRQIGTNVSFIAARGAGVLIITHYTRILTYVKPDRVSVLAAGRIVSTGDFSLAAEIEKNGYQPFLAQ